MFRIFSYLCDIEICKPKVDDSVYFYGVPMFMEDCITERQNRNYEQIPVNTDVLITHTPAYGILDYDDNIHYGSEELFSRISAINLRLHLFGHIHSQNGIVKMDSTTFSNGAIRNANYTNLNNPNLIEIND